MVANTMAPAGQTRRLADIALAEFAAGMGPVTMHGISKKQMSEDRIGRLQGLPRLREGVPEAARGGNQGNAPFCAPKRTFRAAAALKCLPIGAARLSLAHDGAF